ncbi:hypothetical protein ACZ87_03273 [Candidatus Erwinia dacicola]|uniref:Uncharacterized protein n=1 Tax=Candidatus Erwinia dacicola TaxID=252393 RepID=A0A328TKT4_9GAMM|nr:hypothetical protein ACZ87_03273 [Candidatus Erwinia dacicola]
MPEIINEDSTKRFAKYSNLPVLGEQAQSGCPAGQLAGFNIKVGGHCCKDLAMVN